MMVSQNAPDPMLLWREGSAYERYMGRWSRLAAHAFLALLDAPPQSLWLDVGCGTGSLCREILREASPQEVYGIDPSGTFLGFARKQSPESDLRLVVGDARHLPFASATFDAIVSGLALNFVAVPEDAVKEMARVARSGSPVAAFVWDYAEGMQMLRHFWDAVITLDSEAIVRDEGRQFALCRPEPLASLWEKAGLVNVAVSPVEVTTDFRDFEDYWTPFLGGTGPAPGYVSGLTEERRTALRECLRGSLPIAEDGSIRLTARAWAVCGEKSV